MNRILVFTAMFFFLQPVLCNAQKKQLCVAHYNSKNLLENWSDWQEKELKVKEYRDSLNNVLKLKEDAFRNKIQGFQQSIEKDCPSRTKIERITEELRREELIFLKQETAIDSQVLIRKQELENPLNKRLDKALQAVAERRNYTYILDVSTIKMYINGGEDVTSFLREELEEK